MTLNKGKSLKTLSREQIQPAIIILTLVVVILIFTAINSSFLSFANLHSVLLTAVPVGLIAIGECAAIMSGYRHIQNSMKIALMLEEKVDKFDRAFQAQCIAERNYEKLEMYVMELLMGVC